MGRDVELEALFSLWQDKAAMGELGEEDWIEAAGIASAFLERYRLAGKAGLQSDLAAADRIASWGVRDTGGALREQFEALLAGVRAARR
jgi:hypothetical protein